MSREFSAKIPHGRSGIENIFVKRSRTRKPDHIGRSFAVLLVVHWQRVDDVLKQAGDVSGKVVVSCLPMNADDTGLLIGRTSSGAEEPSKKIPRAKLVSAFGTVPSEVFFGVYEARRRAKRRSMAYCGGDGGPEIAYRFERFRKQLSRVRLSACASVCVCESWRADCVRTVSHTL